MERQSCARPRGSNVPLPGPGAPLEGASISRTTYIRHPIGRTDDTKEQQKYLRGSHFNFGNEDFQGVPEYKASYIDQGFTPNELDAAYVKDTRESHISYLFKPNHKEDIGTSVYKSDIGSRAQKGNIVSEVAKDNCHQTTFVMGNDRPDYITEMKAKYIDLGRSDVVIVKGKDENQQRPIGEKLDYITESRAQYKPPKHDLNALGASKEFSRELRKAHFALGSEQPDMNTYYHLYYNRQSAKGREVTRLDPARVNDVKKSHFELGNQWVPGITHYTDQHRWLQPVAKSYDLNASYSK